MGTTHSAMPMFNRQDESRKENPSSREVLLAIQSILFNKFNPQVLTAHRKLTDNKATISAMYNQVEMTNCSLEEDSVTQIVSEESKHVAEILDLFEKARFEEEARSGPRIKQISERLLNAVKPELQLKLSNEPKLKKLVNAAADIRIEFIPTSGDSLRSFQADYRHGRNIGRIIHNDFVHAWTQEGAKSMCTDYENFCNMLPQCRNPCNAHHRPPKNCFKMKFAVSLNLWFPIKNGDSMPLCIVQRKINFGRYEGEDFSKWRIDEDEQTDPLEKEGLQIIFPQNKDIGSFLVFPSNETYHGACPLITSGGETECIRRSAEFRVVAYLVELTEEACEFCKKELYKPACGLSAVDAAEDHQSRTRSKTMHLPGCGCRRRRRRSNLMSKTISENSRRSNPRSSPAA